MAKSIMSTLTGILVQKGKIDINQTTGIETWQNDDRKNITWNQLLQMNSGLEWRRGLRLYFRCHQNALH